MYNFAYVIIETRDQKIQDLLRSSYLLIPRFQRPYSWTSENVEEFWNDVFGEEVGDYFIGTFVVYKDGDHLAVVDGQQRISTCIVLLSCIRDQLKINGSEDLSEGLHELIEKKDINNKKRFTLETESSYPYFQHVIMSNDPNELGKIEVGSEEKLIAQTRDVFKEKLTLLVSGIKENPTLHKNKVSKIIEEELLRVRDKVLNLRFIKIELETEDDAYIIFETLNTRGKDLSVTDLVKNFITRKLTAKNTSNDPAKIKWNTLLETIDGSGKNINTNTFLHHYWLSKHDYVTLKKLFKAIKATFFKKTDVSDFLDELVTDGVTYRTIFDLSFRKWRIEEMPLEEALEALTIFNVKQQVPMVLSVLRSFFANNYSLKNTIEILEAIEKFHFIFTAVTSQRSSGGISAMYASSARNFESAKSENQRRKVCLELKQKLKEKIPSYQEFEANFNEILFTKNVTKQKDLVRYILYKYNRHLSESYSEEKGLLTIEHLSSQSSKISNNGQMGNLILVNKQTNELLGSKAFAKKREILVRNQVLLDSRITNADTWGEKQISDRTKKISNTSYNSIWKI